MRDENGIVKQSARSRSSSDYARIDTKTSKTAKVAKAKRIIDVQ
ncbi:hypothetical protein AGMMS49921_13140 [Endomicrobiia bacterium]|nr:hypothetical protein AGMMS49921_13140 [Endomicrobiia bacterium]